jgi:hypothetical protein
MAITKKGETNREFGFLAFLGISSIMGVIGT